MKKILLFVLLISHFVSQAQSETRTINNANFPVALYSGIPEINIPLFTINTVNNNFSIDLKLENSLYAGTNKNFSTRGIGDAWSLNILGTITSEPERQFHNSVLTYDENLYSKLLADVVDKEGHATYTYSVFGLTGKFVIEKTGSAFTIKIKEQNDYADITLNYSTTGNSFRIHSFKITDKKGFSYLFSDSDKVGVTQLGITPAVTFAEKRTFYLSKVSDKHNRDLLVYNYTVSNPLNPQRDAIYNSNLASVNIVNRGTINLTGPNLYKRTLSYIDNISGSNQKIEFHFITLSPFTKILVKEVRFYNNDETKYHSYNISYKNSSVAWSGKEFRGFPYNICATWDLKKENIYYDQAAVEKITTPEGGVTFYEYEPNAAGGTTPGDMEGYNPEGPIYKAYMKSLLFQPENFTFEPIPLVYNSTYGGYEVNFNNYLSPYDDKVIYVDYQVTPVEILPPMPPLLPDGKYHTPELKVEHYTTVPTGYDVQKVAPKVCHPGIPVFLSYPQTKMMLKIEQQYQSHYNFVRAYYKKPKPNAELIYYSYNVGPRIKRIKTFSQNTTSINATDNVVSEQLFNYEFFNKPRTSSGNPSLNGLQPDYALYKNVTVETPGVGKTEYEFNDAGEGVAYTKENAHLFKYVKSIEKRNWQNQVTERLEFERTFNGTNVSYEKATAQSFESGFSQGYETITESVFDTITRNLTHRKITNPQLAETFEENYTYQKLGNAFYQTKVEKFKNGIPLNQSVFEYQQQGITPAYNLIKTKVAKSTLPLETEKEITRYDDYGNVLEYKTKNGTVVAQIWGYNSSKLVAELKNVSYADIAAATITNIKNYSNVAALTYNETHLVTALNSLRSTHDAGLITTYTYKPLVGLSSVTDANGRKETYQYDSFNRLYRVLNNEGLIIKEYNYHIKN